VRAKGKNSRTNGLQDLFITHHPFHLLDRCQSLALGVEQVKQLAAFARGKFVPGIRMTNCDYLSALREK
jgi:hypothetical protein